MKPRRSLLDLANKDLIEGELSTLFQALRVKRRQEARRIRHLTNTTGNKVSTPQSIADAFLKYYQDKYKAIASDRTATEALLSDFKLRRTPLVTDVPTSIEQHEFERALRAAARRKSPGIDGLPLEFFTAMWSTFGRDFTSMINRAFLHNTVHKQFVQGIIVSLPKHGKPITITDYRPVTVLNTKYKLLARVLANRLKQIVGDQLRQTQYCGVPGNTILDAVTGRYGIREGSKIEFLKIFYCWGKDVKGTGTSKKKKREESGKKGQV
jgi:hypothetical protein